MSMDWFKGQIHRKPWISNPSIMTSLNICNQLNGESADDPSELCVSYFQTNPHEPCKTSVSNPIPLYWLVTWYRVKKYDLFEKYS